MIKEILQIIINHELFNTNIVDYCINLKILIQENNSFSYKNRQNENILFHASIFNPEYVLQRFCFQHFDSILLFNLYFIKFVT